ncbi:DUF2637 domain-containing protein [Streptomyces sp. LHD-70]|uniref:DUF2637 domain-containing protein n=1 Tax=Streptomyces sp. LHD-70 TaxID=3072140 RepID=UPI00280C710C|nr:DUF2637 domain-containing protein [Streptomyces sp. LHD-70]MDQ8707524.1 DUF2637 domain-containing protein [Streptomyces sp. LHD-70]
MPSKANSRQGIALGRTHRILIGVVIAGAVVIAGIGFAGSYAAVRELALKKGFGDFSYVFPIGIDAGICVLLALDLLLTWIRIPFPLLRQTAWLLTAATIAFNGAAAWPDPLGVGMHAVIPILFVVAVEAARHAIGRIADITADKHMEGVRLTRWLLSPGPTFLLWRRMKLWELRSYEQVIKLEQERLVYQARLRSRYGRNWRRKAPVESLMPLRLAKYGVPLADTAPAGLAAAGIEPTLLPPAPVQEVSVQRQLEPGPVVGHGSEPVGGAATGAVSGDGSADFAGVDVEPATDAAGALAQDEVPAQESATQAGEPGAGGAEQPPMSGEELDAARLASLDGMEAWPLTVGAVGGAVVEHGTPDGGVGDRGYAARPAVAAMVMEGQLALEPDHDEVAEHLPEDEELREVVVLLQADPSLSGAAIGRKLQLSERTARRRATRARAWIEAQDRARFGPLRSVPDPS